MTPYRTAVLQAARRLRRGLMIRGGIFLLTSGAIWIGATTWSTLELIQSIRLKQVPGKPFQFPTLAEVHAVSPFYATVTSLIGLLGFGLLAVGLMLLFKTLGPSRRPPRRLSWTLILLPWMFSIPVILCMISSPAVLLWATAVGIASSTWGGLLLLFVVAAVTCHHGIRTISVAMRPIPATYVPEAAKRSIADCQSVLDQSGAIALGYFSCPRHASVLIQRWVTPDLTGHIQATQQRFSDHWKTHFALSGVISSGHFISISNLSDATGIQRPQRETVRVLSGATIHGLQTEFQSVIEQLCIRNDAVPMQISPRDHDDLIDYGAAYVSDRPGLPAANLAWLANPFLGSDPPPIPGNPVEDAAFDRVVASPENAKRQGQSRSALIR